MPESPFARPFKPNWPGLVDCIMRRGTPDRVYNIELFLDQEVQQAIAERYNVGAELDPSDPFYAQKREVALHRFLGYDYLYVSIESITMPLNHAEVADTAELQRASGRQYMDEHRGPITTWAEFESYPWPDVDAATSRALEWCERNLPDDMCVIGGSSAHYCEYLTWLMGYESLCYALYEQRDLVRALADRIHEMTVRVTERVLQFDCVKLLWGSDDMGFNTSTLISPQDLREFVLPGHKAIAGMCHKAGRPYLLHSCGNLSAIMEELIEDVHIDAKHSFEDTIESIIERKAEYGDRVALLGGIDVDFCCRASEQQIRARVRHTLDECMTGGGYVLGTGNSVANYVPVDSYLAMLDEGRRY